MEHQKILNLLNESSDYKFVTRKWNIVNDQLNANYDVGNKTIYSTDILKSNLNNAYVLVWGTNSIVRDNGHEVAIKNCQPFSKCITKIDGTTIDDAEDLDLVMPMYNLLE